MIDPLYGRTVFRPPVGSGPGSAPLSVLRELLRCARPRQWVKNLLVLAVPAAAGRLGGGAGALALLGALSAFTLASAAVYFVNDVLDVRADRAHPDKRHRPVASGTVSVPLARGCGALLAAAAVAVASVLSGPATALLVGCYLLLQLAYCLRLKHVVVLDLVVVASGFLMRGLAGGVALHLPVSCWFLITAGFGALFMVAAKRASEFLLLGGQGHGGPLPRGYSTDYLRFVWQSAACITVLGYCMWALGPSPAGGADALPWRQLSIVPFLVAVLGYSVFADRGDSGAPERVVLGSPALLMTGALWAVLYGLSVVDL